MVIEEGLRRVLDHARAHAPQDARLEWRPMDISGNYPLQATHARKSQILFRLSKNDLARCAQSEDAWQEIRTVVEQQLRQLA